MNTCEYPNLELVEYKFNLSLQNNNEWVEKFEAIQTLNKWIRPTYSVKVFKQTWGSTALAFDVMPDGSAAWGGCAMTDAYTVVIHEEITDSYGIFIGNRPCYVVFDATEDFYEDLKNCNMKSLSQAKRWY